METPPFAMDGFHMARRRYPVGCRWQLIALVRAGGTPETLAKECDYTGVTGRSRRCPCQADRPGEGRGLAEVHLVRGGTAHRRAVSVPGDLPRPLRAAVSGPSGTTTLFTAIPLLTSRMRVPCLQDAGCPSRAG